MSSNLVAFIIGAGPNVGAAAAAKLKAQGYKVAWGSRNPGSAKDDGYLPVKIDAQKKEDVLEAFEYIRKELGPVNVVIYNAASLAIPPDPNDLLSITSEDYFKHTAIGLNAFTAAQAALSDFRSPGHKNHPKAFIVTGNILPYTHDSPAKYFTLGVQKALEARLVATSADLYKADGFNFHYATLVSKTGGIPSYPDEFLKSGPTHANIFWKLISDTGNHWDYRFTLDGKEFPHD